MESQKNKKKKELHEKEENKGYRLFTIKKLYKDIKEDIKTEEIK